jgi:hypothetical protein
MSACLGMSWAAPFQLREDWLDNTEGKVEEGHDMV